MLTRTLAPSVHESLNISIKHVAICQSSVMQILVAYCTTSQPDELMVAACASQIRDIKLVFLEDK